MELGIVGCGAIGSTLAQAAEDMEAVRAISLFDTRPQASARLAAKLVKATVAAALRTLLAESSLVVECAAQVAVHQILPQALALGKDVLVLSVGALVDEAFRTQMEALAHTTGARVYLPSGAMAAVDAVGAAAVGTLSRVELVSTKHPRALADAPWVRAQGLDLGALRGPTVVYSGPASEAVVHFPRNVNVAATLALA